jgi:uronate dehydrogenase
LSDISEIENTFSGEEIMRCDLTDLKAVETLVNGVDAIVHMGGLVGQHTFPEILSANVIGTYNLYEAARKYGVRRIAFASSNHVTGFYRRDQKIGIEVPHRPDSFYGLSKAFGEDLSRLYYDRYGIETVCMRIGSAVPEPTDPRMLATWIGLDDLLQLVVKSLYTPRIGHVVVYGSSDNSECWWSNAEVKSLNFSPRQSADRYRDKFDGHISNDESDPSSIYQGGDYVKY